MSNSGKRKVETKQRYANQAVTEESACIRIVRADLRLLILNNNHDLLRRVQHRGPLLPSSQTAPRAETTTIGALLD